MTCATAEATLGPAVPVMQGRAAPPITVRVGPLTMARVAPAMPDQVALLTTAPEAPDILGRGVPRTAGQVDRLMTVPAAPPMMDLAVLAMLGRADHVIRAPAAPESNVQTFAGSGFWRALHSLMARLIISAGCPVSTFRTPTMWWAPPDLHVSEHLYLSSRRKAWPIEPEYT